MYEIFNKSKKLTQRRKLRKNQTPEEEKIWSRLRNKGLDVKFRRQHGVGPYIVDFYCKRGNLIVEIDGNEHKLEKEYDQERNNYMKTLGLKVLRFWNSEVNENLEKVLERIKVNLQ